jgi:hypothetical protein
MLKFSHSIQNLRFIQIQRLSSLKNTQHSPHPHSIKPPTHAPPPRDRMVKWIARQAFAQVLAKINEEELSKSSSSSQLE